MIFYLVVSTATLGGLLMALLDKSEAKEGGYSPAAHIGSCADSKDILFAGLSADGAGLGLLEPLWKLLTPDGAGMTFLSLGFSGIVGAISWVLAAVGAFVGSAPQKAAEGDVPRSPTRRKDEPPEKPEELKMSFRVEVYAYVGYLRMFLLGVFREWVIRMCAFIFRDELTRGYVYRERWNTGWVDFYKAHMYKYIVDCFNRPIANAPDATFDVIVRSRKGGKLFGPLNDFQCTDQVKTCVNLGSYNYLGFGGVDEFCVPKARAEAKKSGWSSGAPRTEGGTLQVHRDLEAEVARYLCKEDAMVLGMGFATNSTILPALFEAQAGGNGILVLSDELNHRSIVEGVRLSGATVRAFKHNNMPALEAQLKRAVMEKPNNGKPWRKVFIVVEGIYSMEGDFCRLREIVSLKNRYKAYLYLDEAHSIGAVGPTGRGVSELFGVPTSEIEVMMGTFTKSFGSAGGYVAASKAVIDALRRNAPGSIFASAMSPPCAAQALAAFRVISGSDGGSAGKEKLASIRENSNFFRSQMQESGFKVLGDIDSPIIPVMLHHNYKMAYFSRMCLEAGIAVVIVGYPAVPVLYERVRFCISAAHTQEQLTRVAKDITVIGRRLGLLYEKGIPKSLKESRHAQEREYAAWIRSAPMELSGKAEIPLEAVDFIPEPLLPKTQDALGLLDALLEAAVTVEDRSFVSLDLRLFDPLGYAREPLEATKKATEETIDAYGFGACGPRGFYGTTRPHLSLEAKVAEFLGTESAIVYSAGVATASSVVPALVQPGDRVILDAEVHLGLRAGLRLCKCEITWVPHNDLSAVEEALRQVPASASSEKSRSEGHKQKTFVIVEAAYQRTGRLAPLADLVALKEKYGALIIVDESLSFGAMGANGRGLFEVQGVSAKRIDAIIGSLEHAVAGVGGFCAGRKGLIDHQRLSGAGYCFSAAAPPASMAAAEATIADFAVGGTGRRQRLQASTSRLHSELQSFVASVKNLELVSSEGCYVQHLRWSGTDAAVGERKLVAVAKAVASGPGGIRIQVCSPGACGADAAFGQRIGAPPSPAPSLRLCSSASVAPEDIAAAIAALRKAFSS